MQKYMLKYNNKIMQIKNKKFVYKCIIGFFMRFYTYFNLICY